ncbi:PilC/PilY family type IV pilus protein [Janthinobacterium sp.]|uniref:pilus assembly protein n=1 Tax=Janthinobacterium sp. TaxID=1871054 RepID=UPI00260D1803|nr:PilC/PilY family type IV pilus protein [Janthinobacterium sp.]
MKALRWLALIAAVSLTGALAATPTVALDRADVGLQGARVPPNVLLNLSFTHAAAAAAYVDEYAPTREYAGYFDARSCYTYPYRSQGGASVPDLRIATAYFSALKPADAGHGCGGDSFSGNFLNWSGTSMLDIVRYAFTGGDRVIDEVRKTVLQRAYLPDGQGGIDFYAHAAYFPRKLLRQGVQTATPFSVLQLSIVSCGNRLLFGDGALAQAGSCESPGTSAGLGVFLARVRVCDTVEGPLRPDLCMAYGKNYKPVGAVQRHGGRLRIGVFGHMNNTLETAGHRYGGVLRAPLAHLGAQRFISPDFLPQDYPDAEWSALTGVYTGRGGGVTTYINTVGRSDEPRPGAYARQAPLAELLYESLRYLQGRQASASVALVADDGLPVVTPWNDPQVASCQRHIVITLGDAGMAGDRYVPGNIPDKGSDPADRARGVDGFVAPPLDVMAWTRAVGVLEVNLPGLEWMTDGIGGASFFAAGLAHWSHVQALRPGGNAGLLTHYAGDLLPASNAAVTKTPLLLAARYGGDIDSDVDIPGHYLPGNDPVALIAGVRAAFMAADHSMSSIAGPSLMALASSAENAYLFQSQMDLGENSMTVSRLPFMLGADGGIIAGKSLWVAGQATRPVYTPGAAGTLIPLQWPRLDASQRTIFDGQDGLGVARIQYLQGERTREVGRPGGVLHRRTGTLGAAPYGNLVYVGTPSLGLPGADYALHRQLLQARRKMLYLGANDGLLHGFDARTGSELFAYLPQALLRGAATSASTHYNADPLLDGAAASAEVLVLGRWKTVLVSGMGGGAQGVFALDVTDPERFAQMGALWEFTDRDDSTVGNLRAAPGFARLNMRGKDGPPVYRDFVVVSSGYNNTADDAHALGKPAAAIFLLALDKPPGAPWQLGSNYYRLKVPLVQPDSDDLGVAAQALAPPALVAGNDGALSFAYAGDLQGNLWRIDFAGGPPWSDGGARKLIFVARDAKGVRQPITQQLKVAYGPGGGYLLLFGTGKLVEAADTWPSALLPQSLYAVHDDLSELAPTRSRASLEQRSLGVATDGYAVTGAELRYAGMAMDDAGARHGWYLDLMGTAQTGERSVHSPVLAAGQVFFNTVLPGSDACARPATRLYVLDVLSGFAADSVGLIQAGAITGRLLDGLARAPPLVLEIKSSVGAAGATGRAEGRKQFAVVQPGVSGTAVKVVSAPLPAKRLSWREVANWRELHEAAKK